MGSSGMDAVQRIPYTQYLWNSNRIKTLHSEKIRKHFEILFYYTSTLVGVMHWAQLRFLFYKFYTYGCYSNQVCNTVLLITFEVASEIVLAIAVAYFFFVFVLHSISRKSQERFKITFDAISYLLRNNLKILSILICMSILATQRSFFYITGIHKL